MTERTRGAEGFEKVEGGAAVCGCRTQEGGLRLDLESVDLFICVFVRVCLCPSRRVHQHSVQSAPTLAWAPATTTSVVKERHLAVAAALWAHFYPFLRSLRLSQTPPAQLADAAAGQQHQPRNEYNNKMREQMLEKEK